LRELSVGVTGEQLMMTREEELDFIYKFVVDGRKEGRKEDCNVDETKKFVDEGSQKACRVNSSVIRDLHVDEFRGKIEKEKNREDCK
jgi:hypothetical protein